MAYAPRGKHAILNMAGVSPDLLDSQEKLRPLLFRAAELAGVTVRGDAWHKFEPQGLTGVLILSESHLSIHTYPEAGVAFVDLFTCGDHDPTPSLEYLMEAMGAPREKCSFQILDRRV